MIRTVERGIGSSYFQPCTVELLCQPFEQRRRQVSFAEAWGHGDDHFAAVFRLAGQADRGRHVARRS